MTWKKAAATTVPIVAVLLAAGCGAGLVQEVPIKLRYIPVRKAGRAARSVAKSVAVGVFQDARSGRPAGLVGERFRVSGRVDRFRPEKGLSAAVAGLVRAYFAKRGARLLSTQWSGTPGQIWDQPGDIVVSGRVTHLWFTSKEFYTMAEASSVFRIELKVGSPKSGTIITKSIQIEPGKKSNLFWKTRDIEGWISRSISEALERVMPDIERRLAG